MAKILITGGSGLIGRHLSRKLFEKNHEVAILSRSVQNTDSAIKSYYWNLNENIIQREALENVDYIIHLSGENIGSKRWTKIRKKEISDSRIKTGELIYNKLVEYNCVPKSFITASAIGIYNSTPTETEFAENGKSSDSFLCNLCHEWEQVANKFETLGIRTVKIRTGIVLAKANSAFQKMTATNKFGFGIVLGSGKQYLPWIHIDDLCEIYIHAIENADTTGAYNAVAPEYVTYQSFIVSLITKTGKRSFIFNIPSAIIKMVFGQMSEILLTGNKISSYKIMSTGFTFKFYTLNKALADLKL